MKQPDRAKMIEIHPALRTGSTFPLHRFGSEKAFLKWKAQILSGDSFSNEGAGEATDLELNAGLLLNQDLSSSFRGEGTRKIGGVTLALIPSQRNAPALFRAGLIDRIPERVLEDVAAEQAKSAQAQPNDKTSPKADASRRRSFRGMIPEDNPLPITGRVLRLKDGRVGHAVD